MAFGLGDNQRVTLAVVGTDEAGNPSAPPTPPFTWAVSDPAILKIDAISQDDLSVIVSAVGPLGTASVTVTGDNGLVGTGEITVVATDPVALSLVSGPAEHK